MFDLNDLNKEKIIDNLVVGGAGFLGSNLIDFLIKKEENVICVDNLSSGNIQNIIHLKNHSKFKFLEFDIRNCLKFDGKIKKIWHLACSPSPAFYYLEPLLTLEVNFKGTYNLLELARKCDSKILLTSTSEIYGNTLLSPQHENISIDLLTNSPRACYSEGKRVAETLCYVFAKKYNIKVRVARVFNTYGPRLNINDGRVVSNFINQSIFKKELTIFGDGKQTRSFCFINDLINGLDKLMESNFSSPMNLGNTEEITILELAKLITKKIGDQNKYRFKFMDRNLDDPVRRMPSINLAKKQLGWEPKVSLTEGLDKTIEFFRKSSKK